MPTTRIYCAEDIETYQESTSSDYPTYPPATWGAPFYVDQTATGVFTQFYSANPYAHRCAFFRFDASMLPSAANVLSATTSLYVTAIAGAEHQTVAMDWFNWSGTNASADHTALSPSTAVSAVDHTTLTTSAYNTFSLLSAAANINLSGSTRLRATMSSITPSNDNNYVQIATSESTTPPYISVTWNYAAAATAWTWLDFGSFPGATDATEVVTGQTSITASSQVQVEVEAQASPDHTADEHRAENLAVYAGNVVAGTGFTIYGKSTDNTRLYGRYQVRWAWV